ncbi:unnamed protein product [Triticum turgidum subsp. durum]|uniref:Uncharacterized protein n=1 Tax=Triticum turgidum subsp. durum TaxID=4567 RepID=A0A9R1A7K9_TRITD|nr:unnamed protein product [Triticum turgidum subsp. durum]
MASIPLGTLWSPPAAVAVAATSRIARPVHIQLLDRRGPSSARVKIHARTRDAFRSHCDKRADHLPEPEPEPESEPENDDPNNAAPSENVPLVEELLKRYNAIKAEMGVREPPDIFLKEKGRISKYNMKLSSSDSNLNVDEKVQAQLVYESAQKALDLASTVMDIASLGCGMVEISKHTVDQMVRTYATIFCNVAEAAYHQKIEMETTLSFLGALRGLGAIGHIMVQDTMAKLKDGHFKNTIISYMDKHSEKFVKMMKNSEDETVESKSWQGSDRYTIILSDRYGSVYFKA